MIMTQEKNITWLQFNNIFPIIVSAAMVVAAFYGVSTRVAIIETKLDTLIAQNSRLLQNLNDLNSRMITLETLHREILR